MTKESLGNVYFTFILNVLFVLFDIKGEEFMTHAAAHHLLKLENLHRFSVASWTTWSANCGQIYVTKYYCVISCVTVSCLYFILLSCPHVSDFTLCPSAVTGCPALITFTWSSLACPSVSVRLCVSRCTLLACHLPSPSYLFPLFFFMCTPN